MLIVVARAEARARQTGKPTCGICRGMTALSEHEARCMRRVEQFVLDDTTSLLSLTVQARNCDRFDSMIEGVGCG
jgi:hypothetical protein